MRFSHPRRVLTDQIAFARLASGSRRSVSVGIVSVVMSMQNT